MTPIHRASYQRAKQHGGRDNSGHDQRLVYVCKHNLSMRLSCLLCQDLFSTIFTQAAQALHRNCRYTGPGSACLLYCYDAPMGGAPGGRKPGLLIAMATAAIADRPPELIARLTVDLQQLTACRVHQGLYRPAVERCRAQ